METDRQFQHSPAGAWRKVMRPFKAYILTAFVVAVLLGVFGTPASAHAGFDWLRVVMLAIFCGYLVSAGMLMLGAFIAAFFTQDRRAFWSTLSYAALAFVMIGLLWAEAFPVPTK